LVTYILSNTHRVGFVNAIHGVERYRTGYRYRYRPGENPEHLQGTGQCTVSRQPGPEQEQDNPERKTGTEAGAGQKKQLSALGITVVYKCVTHTSIYLTIFFARRFFYIHLNMNGVFMDIYILLDIVCSR